MTPLRQRMIVEMIRRSLARRTQESYLWGVISLANYYNRSPDRISERDIEGFLTLGQRAIVMLDQYRSGVESEPWIFPGAKPGRYLSQSCVQRAYNDAKAAAGITKRGSIHALCHAFATHLVEQGTPLPLVQQLMGHRLVQTTMRYVHLAQCDPKLARSPLDG